MFSILDFDRQRFRVSLNFFQVISFQALRLKEIIVGRMRYKPVLQYKYNLKLYLRLLCIYKALTLKKKKNDLKNTRPLAQKAAH